jgi:hypothetical protein
MNLRHAAALVPVRWYLMAPPPDRKDEQSYRVHWATAAPLSQWETASSYDSARECERSFQARLAHAEEDSPEAAKFVGAFQCIASDDPRLKPNLNK